jgi:hypothetical protein
MTRLDNDLISRKALLEAIRPNLTRLYGYEIREIESLITNAPTIEADSGEAVAWMYVNDDGECEQIEYGEVFNDPDVTPLLTSPQKREWVSLTYDQKMDLKENNDWYNFPSDLIDATEKLLKEVNHG